MPEDKLHIWNLVNDILRKFHFGIIVTVDFRVNLNVHITPHHRSKTVFFCNLNEALHVFLKNLDCRNITVLIHEFTAAHIGSFVHTDINSLRANGRACGFNELFNKFKCFFFSCTKHGWCIFDWTCGIPDQIFSHMAITFDTRNELDTVIKSVIVQLFNLFYRISSF